MSCSRTKRCDACGDKNSGPVDSESDALPLRHRTPLCISADRLPMERMCLKNRHSTYTYDPGESTLQSMLVHGWVGLGLISASQK